MRRTTLPKEYIFSKYPHQQGIRYDIHLNGKNIAYAFTKPNKEGDGILLGGLHVSPKFQHRGIGTFLLQQVEKDAQGQIIRLRARPYKTKNLTTQQLVAFYLKRGYKLYDNEERMMKKIRK